LDDVRLIDSEVRIIQMRVSTPCDNVDGDVAQAASDYGNGDPIAAEFGPI
jgi:hypothetical protein